MNGHARGGRQRLHLLDVLGVALLVEHQQRGALRERARGDQPPRGGRLAGAGRAEQDDVLAGADRQPRTVLTGAVIDT